MNETRNKGQYFDAVKIIHGQNGASLVDILQEGKASGFASILVPDQVDLSNLSIPKAILSKNNIGECVL